MAIAAGPVHSWQYDEIVFNDPFQSFLNILTAHPPTLLPKTRRRPVPFCSAFPTPAALEVAKGGVPEFQQEMEMDEGERLDAALRRAEGEEAGDLLLCVSGPGQLHLAIQVEGGIVHADAGLRRVVERPGEIPWPVVGAWRLGE